jgi:DGQHR domain-containing protein
MRDDVLRRRAIHIEQDDGHGLYLFALAGDEILQVADVSRITRGDAGELIGYQREEVRSHIDEIVNYLDSERILFPNAVILALSSDVRFIRSRGPNVSDGLASAGTLEIPIATADKPKPAWIVDGQQRAVALARSRRRGFPVPVAGFVADSVDIQRDQFFRVNNTKPLPRGLVTELLPEVTTPLPPRLAARRLPSALVDALDRSADSPFHGIIRRASSSGTERKSAIVADTGLVKAIEESLNSTSGCLFPFRNLATGETDVDGIWLVLISYWLAVRNTFPDAWGLTPSRSRLMHGVGIRAMGRLMDRVMYSIDARRIDAVAAVEAELALVAPHCHWLAGSWDGLGGLKWNELQNVPKHIRLLSSYLIRTYVQSR